VTIMCRLMWAAALAAGWIGAGAALAQDAPCQQVAGQAEIGGVLQEIYGVACLQPDGTWHLVDAGDGTGYGDEPVYATGPAYYYDPWYWSPYGAGFAFVFVDRFHHFHRMHHVFFRHQGPVFRGIRVMPGRGVPAGGFHGGGMHGGVQGSFHGGGMGHR